ncbi:MAG: FliG C-terminal domain-containing protein [Elusimicrobiota bacterium]
MNNIFNQILKLVQSSEFFATGEPTWRVRRKSITKWVWFLLVLTMNYELLTMNCFSADNIDSEKLMLETNVEKRIVDALSKFINPQDFIIIIKIEPLIEELAKTKPREKLQIEQLTNPETKKIQKEYILPGVPTKRNLMGDEKAPQPPVQVIVLPQEKETEILKQFVKKIIITAKFDKNISNSVIEEARKIITGLVDFNTVRGDQLIIEKTEFYKKKITWWQMVITFPSVVWLLGIILFAFFLFGPFSIFLSHLLKTLSSKSASQQSTDSFFSRNQAASTDKGGGIGSLTVAPEDGKSGKLKLFAFINERNLRNLAYLLKDESPDRTAMVLSYMRNEWASFVLSQLPPDLQSNVAVELANVRQLEPDDVEIMELELEKKIDYLIGGDAQIVELCDHSDKKTTENILSAISISDPEFAKRVKLQILSIDDLYFIDSMSLRVIFREISLPSWAIGLKAAKNETVEKILKILPTGAAEMLKQEIEFDTTVGKIRIGEEEKRIVMTMRKLRNEGRITIIKGEVPKPEPKLYSPSVSTSQPIEPSAKPKPREVEPIQIQSREERIAKIKERLKKERKM